jgi:hypothetical protein
LLLLRALLTPLLLLPFGALWIKRLRALNRSSLRRGWWRDFWGCLRGLGRTFRACSRG